MNLPHSIHIQLCISNIKRYLPCLSYFFHSIRGLSPINLEKGTVTNYCSVTHGSSFFCSGEQNITSQPQASVKKIPVLCQSPVPKREINFQDIICTLFHNTRETTIMCITSMNQWVHYYKTSVTRERCQFIYKNRKIRIAISKFHPFDNLTP